MEHERLEDTLRRLKQERDEADRRYNDALTALDHAVMRVPDLPHPPRAYDDHQITALNQSWDVSAPPSSIGAERTGCRARMAPHGAEPPEAGRVQLATGRSSEP